MAKPRSPILGYNHNVRYRGLVFHVQTEDSGVSNPHVFTHLFHGGVILSTRKLVYDASQSEDAVKALMQAQHKAVLRDLKRALFDDKIDAYLGGTPGLLPRGQEGGEPDAAPPAAPTPVAAAPEPPPPLHEPEPLPEPEPEPAALRATEPPPLAPLPLPLAPPDAGRATPRTPTPLPASIAIPAPGRITGRQPAVHDTLESRAPTERFSGDAPPRPSTPTATRQAMTPPPIVTRPQERNVSAAFDAIMLEGTGGGGGLAEIPGEEGAVEIHSQAPGAAPPLPGVMPTPERPGSYAQHRRRESVGYPMPDRPSGVGTAPPPPAVVAAPPAAPPLAPPTRPSRPSGPTPARIGGTPSATPPRPPIVQPSPVPPRTSTPSAAPASRAQTQARTRSPTGGGVVVTRPAVIIGAPSRQVGAPAAPTPTAAASAPPSRPSASRIRKAREDSDGGLFGQDLISEKSLDEVILAYLSEDPAEE